MTGTHAHLAAALVALAGANALAQQIETVAELDEILADAMLLEDFEGFSIHGGTTVSAPNPLNAGTAPTGWGILDGVSYFTPTDPMRVYAGFLHGDDSNILWGNADLWIEFDAPQAAVGFDIVDITGNIPYIDTITFYHGAIELGTLVFNLASPGDAFAGWLDAAFGITRVHVVSVGVGFGGGSFIDNVEWGLDLPPACPADLAPPLGSLDFSDVVAFLSAFGATDPAADLAPPSGAFDFSDVVAFLSAFGAGCP